MHIGKIDMGHQARVSRSPYDCVSLVGRQQVCVELHDYAGSARGAVKVWAEQEHQMLVTRSGIFKGAQLD